MTLSPDRWERVTAVFNEALDREPADRARYVADAAAGDDEVRREVERLLVAFDGEGGRFERPAFGLLARAGLPSERSRPEAGAGQRVGPYELVREVGAGGMGAVYEAVRVDDAFRNRVAIKMVAGARQSAAHVRRFLQERRILARLEHPHIARILDGGITDDGRPWFAMEYVDGEPIDAYCAARGLGVRERLALVRQVCDAVQYAHRNLVVHRDLKPSNILVTRQGAVKLLDFGIAKLLADGDTGDPEALGQDRPSTLTRAGFHALTTAYASPEQLRREPVTTASDVYSLGIVLFELLTGRRPFDVRGDAPDELVRLAEAAPPRPSAAVADEAARTTGERTAARLRHVLAGELDNIVLTALRKEPERRYASAHDLAEDLRRYLEGRPVLAQPDTAGYRIRKFVRRHRTSVAAAVVMVLSLVAGITVALWEARRARAEARVAERERAKATAVSDFLQRILGAANPSWHAAGGTAGASVTVAAILDGAARDVGAELRGQPEVESMVRRTIGGAYTILGLLSAAEPQLRAALALARRTHPRPHPDLARALHDLGNHRMVAGRPDEAEPLLREAVAVLRQLGRRPEQQYAMALHDLGLALARRGQLAKGEPFVVEAVAVARRLHETAHPSVAIALSTLGQFRHGRGDLAGAEAALTEALAAFDKLPPGREHWERGTATAAYAGVLMTKGRRDDGERLFDDGLALLRRTLGARHAFLARSGYGPRAMHRFYGGDFARAAADADSALVILTATTAPGDPEVVGLRALKGEVLVELGRHAEAEQVLRPALAAFRRVAPPGDGFAAFAAGYLGLALAAQGKHREAEPLLLEGHTALRSQFGEANPYVRRFAQALARVRGADG